MNGMRAVYELLPESRLCWPCYCGDHSKKHGKIGCLEGIGPRGDFICRCEEPGDYRPPKEQMVIGRARMSQIMCSVG